MLKQAIFWLLHYLFEISFYKLRKELKCEGTIHNLSAIGVVFLKEIQTNMLL